MRLAWKESTHPCRNCGREYPGTQLDRRMWCPRCRKEVIRRATRLARVVAFFAAAVLAVWVFSMVGSSPRFLVIYLVMIAAAYFFLFKLTQRVAFEVIRERGVPVPDEEDDDAGTTR